MTETRKPIVWIVNDSGHPGFEKAREIAGEDIEFRRLTLDDVNYMQFHRLISHLGRGIGKIAHEDDYILLSGAIVINILAISLWLRHFKFCKVLVWHGGRKEYELLELSEAGLDDTLERAATGQLLT